MTEQSVNVSFSVKELLAIQQKALERIESKADESAIRAAEANARMDMRVTLLERRPDLEPRIRVLEDSKHETDGARGYRRFLWPTVAAVFGGAWWVPDFLKHLGH